MSTPNASPADPQPNPTAAPDSTAPVGEAQPESAPAEVKPAQPSRPRKVVTPESLALQMRRLDAVLSLLVLIFAFFLASFAARNSDLWMDLAAGRLIAQGQYTFGADPFAYTTPRTGWTWINHAWLYDWSSYRIAEVLGGIETATGGAALVAIKAVLIMAVAAVMLWLGRRGFTLWVPAVVVALALLAMSPWLLLRPTCLSLLFLAVTLAVLFWPRPADATEPRTVAGVPRHWLLLPLVFIFWVNLDDWFLLGPLTVGLYLLGEAAQLFLTTGFPGAAAPRPRELRALAGVLLVGLAACLLNPYHVHAFTLPQNIAAWLDGGARDVPSFRDALTSPFAGEYMQSLWATNNAAGFAYYALLLLGVLSFLLNRANLRLSRVLLWLVFGLLSAGLAGTIPFFAVVGGAITAVNFQEWSLRRLGSTPRVEGRLRQWSVAGRYLTLVAALAVLALAWSGLLHPGADDYRQTRRVAWRVDADPSYRRAALKLGELRERHVLGDDAHGFNFTPELADYFAWFCPREQGFIDHRYPLFRGVLGPFKEIRASIVQPAPDAAGGARLEDLFHEPAHPINHVILSGPTAEAVRALFRLWDDPARWTMLYGDGRTYIFGWNDPHNPAASFRSHGLHFNALAFGPDLPPQDRAPSEGPEVPAPRAWWEILTQGPAARPLAADEAAMYQDLAAHTRPWSGPYLSARFVASLAPGPGGVAAAASALQGFFGPREESFLTEALARGLQDPDPAGLLVLAIRAGRRGVAASPADANAYYELGMAYLRLWQDYERPLTNGQFQSLQQLRLVQAATAFRRAVRCQPDNPRYHARLASVYTQLSVRLFLPTNPQLPPFNFTDLEMEERERTIELLRSHPPRDRSAEGVAKLIEAQEKEKQNREKQTQLERRKSEYAKGSANRSPLDQARLALDLGLVKEALDALFKADLTPLSEQEKSAVIGLEMKLLIITGETIFTDQGQRLPDKDLTFDPWDKILLAAADGNYADFDKNLEQVLRARQQSPTQSDTANLARLLRELTFQGQLSPQVWFGLERMAQAPLGWAELAVLRGLFALEEGDTVRAARHLGRARGWTNHPERAAVFLSSLGAATPLGESLVRLVAGNQLRQRTAFVPQALVFRYLQLLPAAGSPQ